MLHQCVIALTSPLPVANPDNATGSPQRSTTMAQVLLLAPVSTRSTGEGPRPTLCVVNTHLFGHPDATHVRLFQALSFMRHVERISGRFAASSASSDSALAVVVCGDFNSQPEEGVRDLLTGGHVSADHSDWQRAARFRLIESRAEREANWFKSASDDGRQGAKSIGNAGNESTEREVDSKGGATNADGETKGAQGGASAVNDADDADVEAVAGSEGLGLGFDAQEGAADLALDLSQGIRLEQGCRELPFTFCTATCAQVVDYIYFSPSHLKCDTDLSPFPAHSMESVTKNTAIPSVCFPSDHIALVQDLVWTLK